jgi:CRISPR-associated protein Cas1
VLLRAAREAREPQRSEPLAQAARDIAWRIEALRQTQPLESLRGLEGEAANTYFGVFDHLVGAQKEDFFFRQRSRRPPLDNLNALLSFLYSLLAHDVAAALEGVGLDPAVGFLHRDRPGRPSLAFDLMEEFRPLLADRLALSLVNRQQVRGNGFHTTESGAVMMDDDTRKTVLTAYQKRKQEEMAHVFLGEKASLGLLPHLQAMLLARHLRGDIEAYPPFFWR